MHGCIVFAQVCFHIHEQTCKQEHESTVETVKHKLVMKFRPGLVYGVIEVLILWTVLEYEMNQVTE